MKLIQQKKSPVVNDIVRQNLQAELHRVIMVVDELKAQGDVTVLDAAQKVLWGTLLILDGLANRRTT